MRPLIKLANVLAAIALFVVIPATPSAAEIEPVATDDAWGFEGYILSDFNNFDASVWAIEQIGSRVYVGGRFTSVVSGPEGRTEDRYALAAFDSVTGKLLTDFTPDIRGGGVYAIEATPDGRLFVGGEFTSVEGAANTSALAELDPRTGDLKSEWRTSVERPWSTDRASIRSIAFHGDDMYVGGNFSHASNLTQRVRLNRAARISLSSGRVDPAFNPLVSGGSVWDIALSPDASRLYMVGFFTSVNGDAVHGDNFAAVQTSDGALVSGVEPFQPNLDIRDKQYAVAAVGDLVFVGGEEHFLEVLNASDLSLNHVYLTGSDPGTGVQSLHGGGDFQDFEVVGNRVYVSCHCWLTVLDPDTPDQLFAYQTPPAGSWHPVRSLFALDGTTGELDTDFLIDASGAAGVWAVHGSPDGCLWAGGNLGQSGTTWLRDLGKWCDSEGPLIDTTRPSTPTGLKLVETTPGAISVSWTGSTDDVAIGGYEVYRSTDGTFGSFVGLAQSPTFTDTTIAPGVTYTYGVKALDTSGNLSWRTNLVTATASEFADTVRPTTVRGLVSSVSTAGVELTWNPSTDNVAVTGYQIYRSTDGTQGDLVQTIAGTTWLDDTIVSGTTYTYSVRPIDAANNLGWRSNYSTATAL